MIVGNFYCSKLLLNICAQKVSLSMLYITRYLKIFQKLKTQRYSSRMLKLCDMELMLPKTDIYIQLHMASRNTTAVHVLTELIRGCRLTPSNRLLILAATVVLRM